MVAHVVFIDDVPEDGERPLGVFCVHRVLAMLPADAAAVVAVIGG